MVMVKAFADGSIARKLQISSIHKVITGRAYQMKFDLRKNNISLPKWYESDRGILITDNVNLEPEIYNSKIFRALIVTGGRACTINLN